MLQVSLTKGSVKRDEYLFAQYAAGNWHRYYNHGDKTTSQLHSFALQLFRTESNFETYYTILQRMHEDKLNPSKSPIYYASVLGLDLIISELLLDRNAEVNAQGGAYGNPLQAASEEGYDKVVQLLLERNAEVNAQGGEYGKALQAASARGHDKILQLLLQRNAEVNAQGGEYESALQAAAAQGHDKIVQLLLDRNAGVNAQGGYFGPSGANATDSTQLEWPLRPSPRA